MGNSSDTPVEETFDDTKFRSIGITNKEIYGMNVLKCKDLLGNRYDAVAKLTVPKGAIVVKDGPVFRASIYKIDKITPITLETYHIFDKCVDDFNDDQEYQEDYTYTKVLKPNSMYARFDGLHFLRDLKLKNEIE